MDTSVDPLSTAGTTSVDLTNEPLNIEKLSEWAKSEECGAISMFIGTTRNEYQGRKVLRLEYEAYVPMARSQLLTLSDEIRMRWQSIKKIAIVHRLGVVPVTEASVIIVVSSPHRAESLQAVSFAIDQIKAKIPIWKKEIYENGECDWKVNKECPWQ